MKILITGVAGFIGSNLNDLLLEKGHSIVGIDNFSTGKIEFLSKSINLKNFNLIKNDISALDINDPIFKNIDVIIHLAANADVKDGPKHPKKDLQENTINTSIMLELARLNGIKKFIFSSTGSVYGEHAEVPTKEDSAFPIQTSLYGASKLAGEGLITAYSFAYGIESYIFRFVSILGERYTHGHVVDFFKKLNKDSTFLEILGDGTQTKSYLHVKDCISALQKAIENKNNPNLINIFNIGTPETITVTDSAKLIASRLGLNPEFRYSGGNKGWIGDNPLISLSCERIKRELGWEPVFSIKQSLLDTVDYLLN